MYPLPCHIMAAKRTSETSRVSIDAIKKHTMSLVLYSGAFTQRHLIQPSMTGGGQQDTVQDTGFYRQPAAKQVIARNLLTVQVRRIIRTQLAL